MLTNLLQKRFTQNADGVSLEQHRKIRHFVSTGGLFIRGPTQFI